MNLVCQFLALLKTLSGEFLFLDGIRLLKLPASFNVDVGFGYAHALSRHGICVFFLSPQDVLKAYGQLDSKE